MNDPTINGSDTGGTPLTGDELIRISESNRSVSIEQLRAYVAKELAVTGGPELQQTLDAIDATLTAQNESLVELQEQVESLSSPQNWGSQEW
jgi:hypothetical protein